MINVKKRRGSNLPLVASAFPLITCLVLSVVLTALLNVFMRRGITVIQ